MAKQEAKKKGAAKKKAASSSNANVRKKRNITVTFGKNVKIGKGVD